MDNGHNDFAALNDVKATMEAAGDDPKSRSVEGMKTWIKWARAGDWQAEKFLRGIIQTASESAPLDDLITIAECLVRIRENAA